MSRVEGVNQVFITANSDRIKLIAAKVIDYLLIAGDTNDIKKFIRNLSAELEVANTAIGGNFRFSGCEIVVVLPMIER